jgi:hypothetical protein
MPLILFRSPGALVFLGGAYPVFRVDSLRYCRRNAGYHGRSRASCRQAVLAGRRNGIRVFTFFSSALVLDRGGELRDAVL